MSCPPLLALLAGGLALTSCVTDNPPAYRDVLGPERGASEAASGSGGTGGSGGTAGTAPTSGSAGTAGVSAGAGGQGTSGSNSGGTAGAAGSSGTSGTAGSAATGGTTVNPPIDPNFSPACFMGPTEAGEEIKKGTLCTADDPEVCYRPCGPDQTGWKSETCLAGAYAEGDCTFPPEKDYSCYKIPDEIDAAACGNLSAPPSATDECSAPLCTVCNLDGFYQDTGTNAKEGYCVCREPDETGKRRWTCASTTAWPCPFNNGC